jgi:hypothetical protein
MFNHKDFETALTAISYSSNNSLVVASIFFLLNSSSFNPYTIVQTPFLHVTGNEKLIPLGTPYDPSDITPIETISPYLLPTCQS